MSLTEAKWGRTGVRQGDVNTVLGQGLALPGQVLQSFLRDLFLYLFCMWFMSSCNVPASGTTGCALGFSRGPPTCACLGPVVILRPLGSPGAWLSPELGARAAARGVQHPCHVQHSPHAQHPTLCTAPMVYRAPTLYTAPTPCMAPTPRTALMHNSATWCHLL